MPKCQIILPEKDKKRGRKASYNSNCLHTGTLLLEPLARITQDNTKALTPRIEDQGFYLLEIAMAATLFYFIGAVSLICRRRSIRHRFIELIPAHRLAKTVLISERDEVFRDCLDCTLILFQDVSLVE